MYATAGVKRLITGLALGGGVALGPCQAGTPASQGIQELQRDSYFTLSIDVVSEGSEYSPEARVHEFGLGYFRPGWTGRDTRSFQPENPNRQLAREVLRWLTAPSDPAALEPSSTIDSHEEAEDAARTSVGMELASVAVLGQHQVQYRSSRVGVDLRAARVQRVGLGYTASFGAMDLGMRVNSYLAQLSRQVLVGNSVAFNPILVPGAPVALSQAVGVDLGTAYVKNGQRIGLTLVNVNRPELVYPNLMSDLSPANRASAQRLSALGQLTLADRVQMLPQVVLDSGWRSSRWWVQHSLALNEASDFVGNPQRRAALELGVVPAGSAEAPHSVRLAYQRNLVGDGASAVELNLGWPTMNLGLRSGQVGDPSQGGFGQIRSVGLFVEFPSLL